MWRTKTRYGVSRTSGSHAQRESAWPCSATYPRRHGSSRLDAVLVGALCLAVGGLVGRQTQDLAPWLPVGAGLDNAGWPPRESMSSIVKTPWGSRLATSRTASKTYYLPAELGVHHHAVSGAA